MRQYCEVCLHKRMIDNRDLTRAKLFMGDFCDDCGAIYTMVPNELANASPVAMTVPHIRPPRLVRGWRRPTGIEVMARSMR